RYIRSSGFEFESAFRKVCRSRLQFHFMGHVASRLERWHRIQKLAPRPQSADAHWPTHLVTRKRQKIAAHFPDIHGEMWNRLRRADENSRSRAMRSVTDFFRGVDCAEDIRNVRKRHDLGSLRE